jgi:hypothetical protein
MLTGGYWLHFSNASGYLVRVSWASGANLTFLLVYRVQSGGVRVSLLRWVTPEGQHISTGPADVFGSFIVPASDSSVSVEYGGLEDRLVVDGSPYLDWVNLAANGSRFDYMPAPDFYELWYRAGNAVSLSASPYGRFDHWVLDGVNVGGANPYTVTMGQPHNLTAVFVPYCSVYVNFAFEKEPNGAEDLLDWALKVDGSPVYSESNPEVPLVLEEGSTHGYEFRDTLILANSRGRHVWQSASGLGASGRVGTFTVPSGGGNISAVYRLEYPMTVELGSGNGTASSGFGTYWFGADTTQTVYLSANPAPRLRFMYWTHSYFADNGSQVWEYYYTQSLQLALTFDRPHYFTVFFEDPIVSFTVNATGLDANVTAPILTVDGVDYAACSLPLYFEWEKGSLHSFAWLDVDAGGRRFVWESSSGLSSSRAGNITVPDVECYITATYREVTAGWELSFLVSPSAGGSTDAFSHSVADGSNVSTAWYVYPAEGWYFEGLMADGQFFNVSDRSNGDWGVSIYWTGWDWTWTVGHAVIRDTFSLDIPAMDRAHNVTVVFNKKVYVTFAVSGVFDEDPYWLLTVDGEWVKAKLWSSPVTFEWDWGSVHNFTFYTHSPSDPIFIGWPFNFSTVFLQTNGATSPITVTENMTVVGEFRTEWRVDFYAVSVSPFRSPAGESVTSTFLTVNGVELGWPNATHYSVWVTHGADLSYSFEYDVPNGEGGRWHRIEVSGPDYPATVTGAFNCTAKYVEQWPVTFELRGVDGRNAADPFLSVNGTETNFDSLDPWPRVTWWFGENDTVEYAFSGMLDGAGSFVNGRFSLTDVTGPASPVTVPARPENVTASYVLQWREDFVQTGLDDSAFGTVVTVNGVEVDYSHIQNKGAPYVLWLNNGTIVAYTYSYAVQSTTFGKRFLCNDPAGKSFVATSRVAVDCGFSVQYLLIVSAVGEGRVNVVGSGLADSWHNIGSNAEVWGLPDSGNVFNRWILDGADAGTANPITVLMGDSHRLVGVFVLKQSVAVNYTVDVQWGLKSGVFKYQVMNQSAVPGNLTLCVGDQTFSFRVEDTFKHSENITLADSSAALRVRVVYGDDAETVSFDSTTWVQVPPPPAQEPFPWWLLILVAVVAAVLGFGGGWLYRRLRRRRRAKANV